MHGSNQHRDDEGSVAGEFWGVKRGEEGFLGVRLWSS